MEAAAQHPQAGAIAADLSAIQADQLARAEKLAQSIPPDYQGATVWLAGAAKACAAARNVADNHAAYLERAQPAREMLASLDGPASARLVAQIEADLIEPAATAAAGRRYDVARLLLAQVADRVERARQVAAMAASFEAALQEATERVERIVEPVVAAEVSTIRSECLAPATKAVEGANPDYAAGLSFLAPVAAKCAVTEMHARRYAKFVAETRAEFDAVLGGKEMLAVAGAWQDLSGETRIPGVTDELATLKRETIDAAEQAALDGRYPDAMALLVAMKPRLRPLDQALSYFGDSLHELGALKKLPGVDTNADRGDLRDDADDDDDDDEATELTATLKAALDRLEAKCRLDVTPLLKAGDSKNADQHITDKNDQVEVIKNLAGQWKEAEDALDELTAPAIQTEAARLKLECLDAADAAIGRSAFDEAEDLLEKVIKAAPLVGAYGAALAAAEAAITTGEALREDDAHRIREQFVDSAAALALKGGYAAATDLLRRVPAEAAAARRLDQEQEADRQFRQQVAAFDTDPGTAIKAAREALASLKTDPFASWLAVGIGAIETRIGSVEDAVAEGKGGDAGTLARAVGDIDVARQDLAACARFDAAHKALAELIATLAAAVPAAAQDARDRYLDPAMSGFLAATQTHTDTGTAFTLLEQGRTVVAPMAQLAAPFAKRLADVRSQAAKLTDPFVSEERKLVEEAANAAEQEAAKGGLAAAGEQLKAAAETCATATKLQNEYGSYVKAVETAEQRVQGFRQAVATIGNTSTWPALAEQMLAAQKTAGPVQAETLIKNRGPSAQGLADVTKAATLASDFSRTVLAAQGTAQSLAALAPQRIAAEAALATLRLHPALSVVTVEIGLIESVLTETAGWASPTKWNGIGEDTFKQIRTGYTNVIQRCAVATRLADAARRFEQELVAARSRAAACGEAVNRLHDAPASLAIRVAALEAEAIRPATGQAEARNYEAAQKLLAGVAGRCAEIEDIVAQETRYRTALEQAGAAVAALPLPAAQDDLERIRSALILPAREASARLDYPTALALLAKVETAAQAARQAAEARQKARSAGDVIARTIPTDLNRARTALEGWLAVLLRHPQATSITDYTSRIQATLNDTR